MAADKWAYSNCLAPSRLTSLSRAKTQLLQDLRRSGMLRDIKFQRGSGMRVSAGAQSTANVAAMAIANEHQVDEEYLTSNEDIGEGFFDSLSDTQDLIEKEGSTAVW